jgi:hypothetical protein
MNDALKGDRVMKNTRLTSILSSSLIACALVIGSLASTQSVSAQSTRVLAKANIPFAFQMGDKTLPAGTYVIDRESGNIILLRGRSGAAGFVVTHDASRLHPSDHGTIVFARYGDKYFLRQIWKAGATTGLECPKARAEKAAVVALNKEPATSIELALNTEPSK